MATIETFGNRFPGRFSLLSMRPFLLIMTAFSVLGLGACGNDSAPMTRGTPVVPVVAGPNKPAAYALADTNCQQQTAPVTISKAHIWSWQGEVVNAVDVDMPGVSTTSKSLISPAIKDTTYDDHFGRNCDVKKGDGHYCDDDKGSEKGWSNERAITSLRVCQDGTDLGRLTFETVALASVHYIETASLAYQRVAPNAPTLAPISLSVLPHFTDYYDNYPQADGTRARLQTWITHNMAHFQSPPMIAVFPDDEEDAKSAKGFFWESQFVLGHEFGHHIDFTRNGLAREAMGLEWQGVEHRYVDKIALAAGEDGASERAQLHGAVGETFADLTSHYAEGGTGDSVRGIPCLGQNRVVPAGKFFNGDPKILTDEHLNELFGLTASDTQPCGGDMTFHYADIHIAGAIIAHALDEAFGRMTAATSAFEAQSPADIDQRYKLSLSWMEKFVTLSKASPLNLTGAARLEPIATALEQVADEFTASFPLTQLTDGRNPADQIKIDLCKIIAADLPALSAPPFALTGGTCS